MDEVIGDLGEPLEFVDYRTDDEDTHDDVGVDADLEQQVTTHDADLEVGGPSGHTSDSPSSNVEAEVSILHAYNTAC